MLNMHLPQVHLTESVQNELSRVIAREVQRRVKLGTCSGFVAHTLADLTTHYIHARRPWTHFFLL